MAVVAGLAEETLPLVPALVATVVLADVEPGARARYPKVVSAQVLRARVVLRIPRRRYQDSCEEL